MYRMRLCCTRTRSLLGSVSQTRPEVPLILVPCTSDAALFYNAWTSIPLRTTLDAVSDPKGVQQALGSAKVAILAGRGALAVHSTIEGCVGYFLRLDGLCYVQMLAEAAEKGRGQPMVYVSKEAAEVSAAFPRDCPSQPVPLWKCGHRGSQLKCRGPP
jgi:hypothetical protein